MKPILLFCVAFALKLSACGQTGSKITMLELSKVTRGYQEHVRITPDSLNIYIESRRSADNPVTKRGRKLQPDEWTTLVKTLDDIVLTDIPKLPSPSMRRATDAAMHATLTITTSDGGSYTHGYDDEEPHEELQPLRKKIREIAKTN